MERLLEHKTPILNFIGGSSLGFCIGFSIHEYLHNQEEWKKILRGTKRTVNSNRTTQKSYTRAEVDVVKEENDHSKTKEGSKTNEKLEVTFKDRKTASKSEKPRAIKVGIEGVKKQRDTSKPQIGNTGKSNAEDDEIEELAIEVKTQTTKDSKSDKNIGEKDDASISKIMNKKVSKSIKKKGKSKKVASKIEKGFENDSFQETQRYFLRSISSYYRSNYFDLFQEQQTVGKKESEEDENTDGSKLEL